MENFKQIDPAEITDNFIRAIGREWMPVSYTHLTLPTIA